MTNKFNFFRSLSPENVSGMDRLCIEIDSIKSRKLFTFLFVLFLGIGQMWGANPSVTISASSDASSWTATGTSNTGSTTTVVKSGITVTSNKGYKDASHIREYSGCVITVSSSVGNIQSIEFTSTASGTSNNGPSKISLKSGEPGSYSYSGSKGTWTFGNNTSNDNSIQFNATAQFRWTQVVVTYVAAASYTVTYDKNGGTGTMSDGTGASITLAECGFTAPSCQRFKEWNTEQGGGGTSYDPGDAVTSTMTLYAIWEDIPTYTVTLKDDNSVLTQPNCSTGVELPSRTGCTDYTFVGWTKSWTSAQSTWTTTAPTIIDAGNYTPTENEHLYPVYTKSDEGGTSWEKVTSAPSNWSGDYVIVNSDGNAAMISDFHSGTSGEFKSSSVTIENNKITTSVTDKMIWIVAKNGNNAQYSFKNKSTGTYAKITGTSSTNAALDANAVWFTIESTGTSNVWDIASVTNSARCFAWYTNNSTFRTYAKSNNNTGYLYKKSTSSVTSYISIPDCTSPACENPTIGTQPAASTNYAKNTASVKALSVAATGTGTLTYQWYSNTTASNDGGTPISGATNASYTPSVDAVGTKYYYCVVGVQGQACSTTSNVATINVTQAITGISLNKDNTTLEIGDTETLTATITPNDATEVAVWVSSAPSVATVDQDGVVTAVAVGSATITCKSQENENIKATCAVTVTPHVVTPGKYDLTLANAFWGTNGTGADAGHTASGLQNDISVSINGNSGTQNYINNSETRIYGSHSITFSVPAGFVLKEITGLGTSSKSDIAVASGSTGSINTRVWTGSAQSVTFDVNSRTDFSTVSVTYAAEVKYAVSFSAPTGGTLVIKDGDNAITSGDEFAEEKVLDVLATPTAATHHGGTVKVVKTEDTEVDVTSTVYNSGTKKLTIPDYAITVSATFVADASISVAVANGQSEWGSVKLYNGEPTEVSSGSTFKPSAEFIIEATPSDAEVYEFVSWTKSEGSDITLSETDAADNAPTLTAGEVSTTFTATFREKTKPYLAVDPTSLSFGPIAVNGSQEKTFALTAENLAANATLTITSETEGDADMFSVAASVAKDGDGVIAEDVTVTYNPTAVGTHTATLTITSEGAESVEITLSGSAELAYTAKWYVNGSEASASTVTAIEGTELTFPANPIPSGNCQNLTFVGWLTSELEDAQDEEPENLIKDNTGHTMPINGITYYAVFVEKEGEDVASGYSLSNAAPADGDQVIIARLVSGTYYGLTNAANPSTSALTVSAGVVSNPANEVIWDVESATSGVYLRPTGVTGQGLHMNSSALKVANGDTNGDIVFSANGNGSFKGIRADEARWIVTSSTNGLSCSDSESNAAELYVFKYAAGSQATYSNYVTSCVLCNKVTFDKAGQNEHGTFELQVDEASVSSVRTCSGNVEVNVVATLSDGYGASFAVSGVEGASISNNIITIPEGAAGTLTVTATIAQINYTVTMAQTGDANATLSDDQENKHYGDEITVSAEAVEGYAFNGWTASPEVEFADASALSTTFDMPNSNVTVTANFAQIATCTISFMVNGAEVDSKEVTQALEYSLSGVSHPTIPGFEWVGWSETKYDNEVTTQPTKIDSYTPKAGEGTKTLYGVYKRVDTSGANYGKYVRATEVAEGDYLIVCESQNVAFDGSLTTTSTLEATGNYKSVTITEGVLTLANADNYVFSLAEVTGGYSIKSKSGYYIGCTGSGNGFNSSTTQAYTNTVSLNNNNFTITSSGGAKLQYYKTSGQERFRYYTSNQQAIALYKKDNGTTYYTSSPVEKVTISFNANGGNGGCSQAVINKGSQLTICSDEPTKSRSDFTGWNSKQDGSGDAYVAGQTYAFNATVTLYAQWSDATPHAVTYAANGATGSVPTDETEYYPNDEVTLAAKGDLAKAGFEFVGWTYGSTLYQAGETFVMPNEDVTLTAQWKKLNIVKLTLVTSAQQLVDGSKVVLANQEHGAVAGDGSNILASVTSSVSFNEDKSIITTLGDGIQFTLEQTPEGWALKYNNKYLKPATSNKIGWQDTPFAWTITFDGVNAKIENNSTYAIRYNGTSGQERFAAYGLNGVKPVQLYASQIAITDNTDISDLGYVAGDVIVVSGTSEKPVTLTIDSPVGEDAAPEAIVVQDNCTVVVNSSTSTANLTVENGGTVEVKAETTTENLDVKNGGKVTINTTDNKKLTVKEFVIEMTPGVPSVNKGNGISGQVENAQNLTIEGDAFFDFTLAVNVSTPAGATKAAKQWHNFSVPFPVDAINGVYNAKTGEKLTNEVDYAIETYHGDLRANGQYGWKKFRGIMQPGITYSMTVNGDIQTYRFKKVEGSYTFAANPTVGFTAHSGTGTSTDKGWNGLGNLRLDYASVDNDEITETTENETPGKYVQVLDAVEYRYVAKLISNINFTVGAAFFIQAAANGTMEFAGAQDNAINYAPARTPAKRVEPIEVSISHETGSDAMFITANEDAKNEYVIGHDMQKMFATNNPTSPLIYSVNYGDVQLSAEDAPLVDDKATYELRFFVPATDTYTISAENTGEATIFLTYEGNIIWDLTISPYEADLTKGRNDGYGLIMQAKAPQISTGVSGTDAEAAGVQKVVINNHVYILRGGEMYDVTGKAVK